MITRAQARAIAESALLARSSDYRISSMYDGAEGTRRLGLYRLPDPRQCWVAYIAIPVSGPQPSEIIMVDKESGVVVYVGSANDEG